MIALGDTLYGPLDRKSTPHLWVIIYVGDEELIMVYFTTYRRGKDDTCKVSLKEHPFIIEQSCINYHGAQIPLISNVEIAIKNGYIKKDIPVSRQLLRKIKRGVVKSPHMRKKYKKYFARDSDVV